MDHPRTTRVEERPGTASALSTADVAVVIPALNEAATIVEVATGARAVCDTVIVVDDGSSDGSAALIGELPVTVIRHDATRGKAAALMAGFKAALARGAAAVVTLDGDLQHKPGDIPRFVARAAASPETMIVGRRIARNGRRPRLRILANKCADYWISRAGRTAIVDTQCGFRLYPRTIIETVSARHDRRHGFVFESEFLINALRAGYGVEFVEIDAIYAPNPYRSSHYKPVLDTARIAGMIAGKILSGDESVAAHPD